MSKHTPGPWRYEMHRGTNHARIFIFQNSGDSLAGYCGEANARLIAAAPDMIAALQKLTSEYGADIPPKAYDMVAEVVAKATGEVEA